jgi:hypothetical protein
MDTRLVGMNAGQPRRDYAIWPEAFEGLKSEPRAMLFIVKPEDQEALSQLEQLFPAGTLTKWQSEIPGKDFLIFFVPADSERMEHSPREVNFDE